MPAPQAQAISTAARQYFTAQGIQLPMQWRPMGDLYPRAFTEPELQTPATGPDSLFHEPTRNKYHTGAANMMAEHYGTYLDAVSEAIAGAIDKWMRLASVVAIAMAGSLGIWRPNGVSSPALAPLILAAAPRQTPGDRKYSQAIAAALGDHWQIWHQSLGPRKKSFILKIIYRKVKKYATNWSS